MSDPVPAIAEASATGAVAEIFAGVGSTGPTQGDPRELLSSGVRQIINSRATPRTSISKSSPCTGGRAKCHVKPPEMAPRRTNSSAMRRWMSKIV